MNRLYRYVAGGTTRNLNPLRAAAAKSSRGAKGAYHWRHDPYPRRDLPGQPPHLSNWKGVRFWSFADAVQRPGDGNQSAQHSTATRHANKPFTSSPRPYRGQVRIDALQRACRGSDQ